MSTDLERDLRETLSRRHATARISSVAPAGVLRRARRRATRTVVLAAATAVVVVLGAVGGVRTLLRHEPNGTVGDESAVLPTQGPAPGEISLLLASGEVDGQRWNLRVTDTEAGDPMLSFDWEGLGAGGSGLSPMQGSRVFQGYGGSSSPEHRNDDATEPPLPREVAGQVRADAARVELRLEGGPSIQASVYQVPDELVGTAKVFLLFVPADTLLVAGDLVAFDASGAEIGRVYLDMTPVSLFPKVLEEATPEALEVMKRLQLAGAIVARYYDEHGSFSGLEPATASAIAPGVTFNTSDTAIPGEVSLRVSGPQNLVLASATPRGEVYSACMVYGPGGAVTGRNDTSDPYACSNGWLNVTGPSLETGTVPIANGSDENGNLWSLALIDVGKDWELEYLISTIGTSRTLAPLGTADLGSIAAIPPSATPQDAPPVEGLPTSIYGLASDRVARIELDTDDGQTFEGRLYPIATDEIDAPQAFLIIAPIGEPMAGTVVAFDGQGNELRREHVETVPMP